MQEDPYLRGGCTALCGRLEHMSILHGRGQ